MASHVEAVTGLSSGGRPEHAGIALAGAYCVVVFSLVLLGLFLINPIAGFAGPIIATLLCLGIGAFMFNTYGAQQFGGFGSQMNNVVGRMGATRRSATNLAPAAVGAATGAGQTIGIVAFDTFKPSDVADYLTLIGARDDAIDKLSMVPVNGGVAAPGSGESEVLLDVDTIMSIAPGAHTIVYHAPFDGRATSYSAVFNAMIDDGVTIISNSWASCEDQVSQAEAHGIDAVLQSAAASGISVFNGSGDTGSTCLDGSPNTVAVPADSPHATAVGGTSLIPGPGFTYGTESWWNGGGSLPPTGQGGFGVSRHFARPSYQDGLTAAVGRSVPDVVAYADPVRGRFICQASAGGCPNGLIYGGTSMAAPEWAGLTALLNERQGTNLGALNPAIYPLIGATLQGLTLFDITTTPAIGTVIANLGSGVIGPDGCLYASNSDTVYKVANANGACQFNPTTTSPSLTLTPALVNPDPPQGATQELTATFHNLAVPPGTPVFFQVTGANPRFQMLRTDAVGQAALSYTAANQGNDVIIATATVGDSVLTSNKARVTWGSGRHVTFLTLNPSPIGGKAGELVTVRASLNDVSITPPVPVANASVDLTLGSDQCTAVTDANGLATCAITPDANGTTTLTATFAGTNQLLPASATVGFQATGVSLSHFMSYRTAPAKGVAKLVKFGAVDLSDSTFAFTAGYNVLKPSLLAAPASKNGEGFTDPDTHLEAYIVKPAKGSAKFQRRTDLRVANQCGGGVVAATKSVSLLLPTATDLINPVSPVSPPDARTHNVDHFLCYQVKAQKKRADGTPVAPFPKGVQVDVMDRLNQLQSRRYDLKRLVWLCNSVSKAGSPKLLTGPGKGQDFPITPATIRNPNSHLLCYTAKLAKKHIAQKGCGPVNPKDKGTAIAPPQAKHVPVPGVHLANQFESAQIVGTKNEALFCIPSTLLSP